MKIPLFDIDGTLVKSGSDINRDAFHYAVKKAYGIEAYHTEIDPEGMVDNQIVVEVLKLHGLTENEILANLPQEIEAVVEFAENNKSEIKLEVLPGVFELVKQIKNLNTPMGALTGNVEGLAWIKLESVGLKQYISFGAFGSQAHVRSELVEIARKNASKKFNKEFKTEDFVIIGDTPKDILCAREAGIKVIAIATGKFSYEKLKNENPDLLIESLEGNIERVIDFLNNN